MAKSPGHRRALSKKAKPFPASTIVRDRHTMTKQQRYLSYLLRMWQTSDGKQTVWRASLTSPGSGEQHGFASLEELADFVRTRAEQADDDGKDSAVSSASKPIPTR